MKRVILIVLMACIVASASAQLKDIQTNNAISFTPSVSTLTDTTTEAGFTVPTTPANTLVLWGIGAFPITRCELTAATNNLYCNLSGDGASSGSQSVDLSSRVGSEVRIVWSHDKTNATGTLEVWSGDCATKIATIVKPIGTLGTDTTSDIYMLGRIGGAGGIKARFIRQSSGITHKGVCPADAPTTVSDLWDFTFDASNATDRAHSNTAIGDTPSYSSSVLYNPVAGIGGYTTPTPTFKRSHTFTLTSTSFAASSPTGVPSTFLWTQTAGPGTLTISNHTNPTATFSTNTSGQYRVQLQVGDGINSGTTTTDIGIVSVDVNGLIHSSDAAIDAVVGPVQPIGDSPYIGGDVTAVAVADILRTGDSVTGPTPFGSVGLSETPITGTCSVHAGPSYYNDPITDAISGASIAQVGNRPYTGIVLDCSGTSFAPGDVGKFIYIHADALGNSTYAARSAQYISAVADTTHIVIAQFYWLYPLSDSVNMPISWAGNDYNAFNIGNQGTIPWSYYEADLGMYRMWLQTGLDKYKTAFENYCVNHYTYALDYGYNAGVGRNAALSSMAVCAKHFHPEWFPSLVMNAQRAMKNPVHALDDPTLGGTSDTLYTVWQWDVREEAFHLIAASDIVILYPTSAATLCPIIDNNVNYFWLARQESEGFWQENPIYWGVDNGTAPGFSGNRWGTAPWRGVSLGIIGLESAYDALSGPCNAISSSYGTRAAQLYTNTGGTVSGAIKKALDFMWNYGRTSAQPVSVTAGNPTVVRYIGHGFATGAGIQFKGGTGAWSAINNPDTDWIVQKIDEDTFSLKDTNGVNFDSTGFGADPGSITTVGGGLFWAVGYAGKTYGGGGIDSDVVNAPPGLVSVTSGSATVTGSGTSFTTLFAPCDGSRTIAIRSAVDLTRSSGFRVIACASDTSLTIDRVWPFASEIDLHYAKSKLARNGAAVGANSIAPYVEDDYYSQNGRALAADPAAGHAWIWHKLVSAGTTTDATYKNRGLYFVSKIIGYPAAGAGATGAPIGPGADGYVGALASLLPASSSPPSGGGQLNTQRGKYFGMYWGIGGVPSLLASEQLGTILRSVRHVTTRGATIR